MNEHTHEMLHASADRLALEAARRSPAGKEANDYIDAYKKVLEFLISAHDISNPQIDGMIIVDDDIDS